jgi:hypothetical protein
MHKIDQVIQEGGLRIQENQEFLRKFGHVTVVEGLDLLQGEVQGLDVLRKVSAIHETLVEFLKKLSESVG